MARPVVGNPFENQIATVSPTAQVVDIFERGVVERNPLGSLAGNLSRLSQKADRTLGAIEKRLGEKEFAEGQALYAKTRKSIGDAVRAGIIDEAESPYLRKGYRISNLNVLASKYATELSTALDAKQLYKNGNPAAAEKFTKDFYDKFVTENELSNFGVTEIAEYLLPTTQKSNAAFISSWRSKHLAWQKSQNYVQLGQELGKYTSKIADSGPLTSEKLDSLSLWFQSKIDTAELDGMNRAKVNKAIVDSLLITAEENNTPELLTILDKLKSGTGRIGQSVSVRKSVLASENRIASSLQSIDAAAARKAKAENEANTAALETQAFIAGSNLINAKTPQEKEAAQVQFDAVIEGMVAANLGTEATTALKFYQAMGDRNDRNEDPVLRSELFNSLTGAETPTEVRKILTEGLKQGAISQSTALTAYKAVIKADGQIQKFAFADSNTPVKGILDSFIAVVTEIDPTSMTPSNQININDARRDFEDAYLEWEASVYDKDPNAKITRTMMRDAARQIVDKLTPVYVSQEKINQAERVMEAISNPDPEPRITVNPKTEEQKGLLRRLRDLFYSGSTRPLPTKND
jgi:hypothetical protein